MLVRFLLGMAAAPLAAQSLGDVLVKMDQAASAFRGLSASVRRVAHTHVINEDSVESGTMLVKRSKGGDLRMLIELRDPDPRTLAFRGRKLEVFYPKILTVQEFDAGGNRRLEQFFLLGFATTRGELEREYAIRLPAVTGGVAHVELTPKSQRSAEQIKKVELWITMAIGYPAQQKFHQSGGDYNVVSYTDLKINPELADDTLKLKLPPGVKREHPQKGQP
ncbi:MAG: LolA family protein [Bryobacteraceae bacterium]